MDLRRETFPEPPDPTRTAAGEPTGPPCPASRDRFLPGALVGERYRIVALLGRGGMGEVYRADDLRLGQPVALKFLPEPLERDARYLDRLLREVRTARQISHPNVCRVHDVGETGGRRFLSMEYVDGEDLQSLLRRIGRPSREKASDIAAQIAAGLAAAHGLGILHRDLKPANVMLDGRGRVRIMDFGLAALAADLSPDETGAGTPAYMAPEQIGGGEITLRSDVYALGLVLYELFTGRPAFEGSSLEEVRRRPVSGRPVPPSRYVPGIDPQAEQVILQCLEPDPAARPASARAVAATLPGGDLLLAAVAAGETPSPELVAAAGPRGVLAPRTAGALVAATVAGLLGVALLADASYLPNRVAVVKSPEALAEHARAMLLRLRHDEPARDAAWHIVSNLSLLRWVGSNDPSRGRWDAVAAPGSPAMLFDYRESPRYLVPAGASGLVDARDPPPREGSVFVGTDLRGRLLRLRIVPPLAGRDAGPGPPADWSPLLELAGLAPERLQSVAPTRQPWLHVDERAAWTGTLADLRGLPVRIEAGALRGAPIFFEVQFPDDPALSVESEAGPLRGLGFEDLLWLFFLIGIAAVTATRLLHNLRLGRSDRRGAFRLAAAVFGLRFGWWVLGGHHVPEPYAEIELLVMAVARSLFPAAVLWALYVALEPEVRRYWPQALVGWSRLLAGRVRDPLVGRDVLAGTLVGIPVIVCMSQLHYLLPRWIGIPGPPPLPYPGPLFYTPPAEALLAGRFTAAALPLALLSTLYGAFAFVVLFVGLRRLLRWPWAASVAIVAIWTLVSWTTTLSGYSPVGLLLAAAGGVCLLATLVRYGLLAMLAAGFTVMVYNAYPITANPAAPFFGTSLVALAFVAGAAFFGAFTAAGGGRAGASLHSR